MRKASARRIRARQQIPVGHQELELEIASLFSELSHIYNKSILLTKKLRCRRCRESSDEISEVGVMLKNALRIFSDAMSHMPS